MKSKRHKQIRSNFRFYELHFGFKAPQKVLVDGNFLKVCTDIGFDYYGRIHGIIGCKLEFWTSECVQRELRELGPALEKVHQASFRLKRFRCQHSGLGLSAGQCLKSLVGRENEARYVVATQDPDLWSLFGKATNVPILYFQHSVLKMKEPSTAARKAVETENEQRLQLTEHERKAITELKKEEQERQRKIHKERLKSQRDKLCIKARRPAKGPNPLSCKRPQKHAVDKGNNAQ